MKWDYRLKLDARAWDNTSHSKTVGEIADQPAQVVLWSSAVHKKWSDLQQVKRGKKKGEKRGGVVRQVFGEAAEDECNWGAELQQGNLQ